MDGEREEFRNILKCRFIEGETSVYKELAHLQHLSRVFPFKEGSVGDIGPCNNGDHYVLSTKI